MRLHWSELEINKWLILVQKTDWLKIRRNGIKQTEGGNQHCIMKQIQWLSNKKHWLSRQPLSRPARHWSPSASQSLLALRHHDQRFVPERVCHNQSANTQSTFVAAGSAVVVCFSQSATSPTLIKSVATESFFSFRTFFLFYSVFVMQLRQYNLWSAIKKIKKDMFLIRQAE